MLSICNKLKVWKTKHVDLKCDSRRCASELICPLLASGDIQNYNMRSVNHVDSKYMMALKCMTSPIVGRSFHLLSMTQFYWKSLQQHSQISYGRTLRHRRAWWFTKAIAKLCGGEEFSIGTWYHRLTVTYSKHIWRYKAGIEYWRGATPAVANLFR